MRNEPKLSYLPRVRRDMRRCLQFLRRKASGRAAKRMAEVMEGVRRVRANPLLFPVRKIHPETGAELRRHNVAQFVILYAYFGPTPSLPYGEVSIRAIVPCCSTAAARSATYAHTAPYSRVARTPPASWRQHCTPDSPAAPGALRGIHAADTPAFHSTPRVP
jgi:hypothetical protein